MNTIYAVVVTYNRKEMLTECLDAILAQTAKVDKIVVVDNASTDGTGEYLTQKGYRDNPEVLYSRQEKNTGGAGGFFAGMKIAREAQPDWVWIMDDDVIPAKDCLEQLIVANNHIQGDVSFLASQIRGMNNEAMNVPKIDRKQSTKYLDWYEYLDQGIVKIVKATFVSLLINIKAINKCGLPWAPFFIWGDDSEYTQRVIRDFGPAYMVGKSLAIHKRASADELSIVKELNINRIKLYYYYYRNNLIGFWEYETALYKFLCMGKLGFDFLMVLLKGKYKGKKCAVICKAFFAFVFGTYGRVSFRNRVNL